MKKRKLKIDPKTPEGLLIRKDILDGLCFDVLSGNPITGKDRYRRRKIIVRIYPFYYEELRKESNGQVTMIDNFIRTYFKGLFKISDFEIDSDINILVYEATLKNQNRLLNEIANYWDDIIKLCNPYSVEKQKVIIGKILLEKYKVLKNRKLVITEEDLHYKDKAWSQLMLYINPFGVLRNLKKEGLIKKIDDFCVEDFPFLSFPDYQQLHKCQVIAYPDIYCKIELILTNKGVKELDKYETITVKDVEAKETGICPLTLVEEGIGFFQFNKNSKKIRIGSPESRKFKLLQSFCSFPNNEREIDSFFESIRVQKDNNDSRLQDSATENTRKIELIEYTIKELQKIEELKGRLKHKIYKNNRRIRLEIL
jgi:hypothetical protein